MSNEKRSATPISALPLLVGGAAYYLFLRPQMKKWGTRLGESQRRLPGDDIIPKPNLEMTHAIDIDAPPEAVWPWLNQMGRERSGYYGLDTLLNQGIPSVNFLRKDIPGPVRVEMSLDKGFHVMALEENREYLFGAFNHQPLPGVTFDVTSLYLLERRRDGSTRLLVRHRVFTYGMLGPVFNLVYEALYFAFIWQQLKHLKQYAESMAHLKVQPST